MKFLGSQSPLFRGRWWFIFIAAWVGGCAGPKDPQPQQSHPQGPVSVTTIKVMPGTVPMVDEYAGRTAGVREVEVRARVSATPAAGDGGAQRSDTYSLYRRETYGGTRTANASGDGCARVFVCETERTVWTVRTQ